MNKNNQGAWADAVQRIKQEQAKDFATRFKIAGLDPARHAHYADWEGVDFTDSDLNGFDFTGSRLVRCKFTNTKVMGARFEHALIDDVRPGEMADPHRTRFDLAADWTAYSDPANWKQADRLASDDKLRVGAIFQDAPFAPEMVVVPAGDFVMGSSPDEIAQLMALRSEGNLEQFKWQVPQVSVILPAPFAIGRDAVSCRQFEAFREDFQKKIGLAPSADSSDSPEVSPVNDWPAVNVSTADAEHYCTWLSRRTGKRYRLPSEAEWEYVARARTTTMYWWGDTITPDQARYQPGDPGENFERKARVTIGYFAANPFGLHNVHGNTWEWCADPWNDSHKLHDGTDRPVKHGSLDLRVVKGGSWINNGKALRSASRGHFLAGARTKVVGFRVARALDF
jgi:formylglycine-generating enzyme required for sulfatase activity